MEKIFKTEWLGRGGGGVGEITMGNAGLCLYKYDKLYMAYFLVYFANT